ncbi:unnamed protein product [Phytomonas sp. Hart1]|nr:unnamed protein product [Phytomonas sp. Hart1]|eukprot:CCW70133.1 unnamed protein product [Phytomonas sp. isolate Hart1]
MGNSCYSREYVLDDPYARQKVDLGDEDRISGEKQYWKYRLIRMIGLDPTQVFCEFAYKIPSIRVFDMTTKLDESSLQYVLNCVMEFARLCDETDTYGRRFFDEWERFWRPANSNAENYVLPRTIISFSKVFRMLCLKSGMVKIKSITGVPNFNEIDEALMIPPNFHVYSATFHLMQLSSQNAILFASNFISDITNLKELTIHKYDDYNVEVSLTNIEDEQQTKRVIKIRHETSSIFLLCNGTVKNPPKFQVTWELNMYIDKEILKESFAPFQPPKDDKKPKEKLKSPLKGLSVIQPLPTIIEEDEEMVEKDENSPIMEDLNVTPAEEQQAQKMEEINEINTVESKPAALIPPQKPPRPSLKKNGIATVQQEYLIRRELVHCDAKIIKAVLSKPSRSIFSRTSTYKKTKEELRSILRNRYQIELVRVDEIESEDAI